jgi:hypothetical protein
VEVLARTETGRSSELLVQHRRAGRRRELGPHGNDTRTITNFPRKEIQRGHVEHASRAGRQAIPEPFSCLSTESSSLNGYDAKTYMVVTPLGLEPQSKGGAAGPAVVGPAPTPPDARDLMKRPGGHQQNATASI